MPLPLNELSTQSDWVFVASNGKDPFIDFQRFVVGLRPTKGDLDKVGQFLVGKRILETLAGFDVRGDYFHPYSPSYQKRKKGGTVNLRSNGMEQRHMVEALDWRSFPEVNGAALVSIGIFGDTELALRARIHDKGAIVRRPGVGVKGRFNYQRMSKVRKKVIAKLYEGTYFTIPQREWLTPTKYNIDEAAEVLLKSMWDRATAVSEGPQPVISAETALRQSWIRSNL